MKLVVLDYVISGAIYFQAEDDDAKQLLKLIKKENGLKLKVEDLPIQLYDLVAEELGRDVNPHDAEIEYVALVERKTPKEPK